MTPDQLAEIHAVQTGQKRWAILHADNAAILPDMAEKSVDHVITDPPYEAEAHTLQRRVKMSSRRTADGQYEDSRAPEVAPLTFEPITEDGREAVAAQIARVATRWMIAFCQVEAVNKWSLSLVRGGANTKRIGVWIKPDGMPQFSGDRPGMGYESIVFGHAPGRSRWNGGGRVAVFEHNKHNGEGDKTDHQTQKPLALMSELVELFTDPGELILDPFAGSGTTGVAAIRLGRFFIGIEKDAKYAEVARQRLEAEERGQSLREYKAGQLHMFADGGK